MRLCFSNKLPGLPKLLFHGPPSEEQDWRGRGLFSIPAEASMIFHRPLRWGPGNDMVGGGSAHCISDG